MRVVLAKQAIYKPDEFDDLLPCCFGIDLSLELVSA
jgi:hypothetical protein